MSSNPGGAAVVDANAQRIALLGEFITNGAKEAFDPAVYIACKQYLHKQESARIAALQLTNEELMPSSEFSVMTWSERMHTVLTYPFRTRAGQVLVAIEVTLVIITCVAIIVESMPQYNPDIYTSQVTSWTILDGCITNIFLIQLVVTILVHPPPKRHVIFSLRTLIDVLTILPFYVQLFSDPSRRNLVGMLKALRILRVVRLAIHATSFHVIALSMWKASKVLLAPIALLIMINFTLGSAVYFAERGKYDPATQRFMMHDCVCEAGADYVLGLVICPLKESQHYSILHSMWLMIQATTTVGYGDMVPLCDWGKILTTLGMFVGSLVLSIPIAVVGSYYSLLQFEKTERVKNLKRLKTLGSQSSFASISSATDVRTTVTHLTSVIESSKAVGPRTAAENLCSFLKQNVRAPALIPPKRAPNQIVDDTATTTFKDPMTKPGSALTYANLYYPSSELMYFVQLYLEDYAEELALRGRDAMVPKEIAQLLPTSSASVTVASKNNNLSPAFSDGSIPLESGPSKLGPKPEPPVVSKYVAPSQLGLVKPQYRFMVQLFERLGDDTLTPTGMLRKAAVSEEKAKWGEDMMRKGSARNAVAATAALAQQFGAPPPLFPGMYRGATAARVTLRRRRGVVIPGQETIDSGDIIMSASISFAPNTGADHVTFAVEPWTRSTRETLPRLLAATLGKEHESRLNSATLTDDFFVSERQLYPGNVVAIRGTSYQYLDDDSDMEAAQLAFECAIAEVLRRRSKSVSKLLHGMPVKPSAPLQAPANHPGYGGEGSSPWRRGARRSPSASPKSTLRRRGTSPQQIVEEPTSRFGLPPDRATQLHAAHTLPDGELAMPFLSRIAIASSHGVAPSVAAERQRVAKLKEFNRNLAGEVI